MLIANNNQVEDWLLLDGNLRGNFSGKILEMKFLLKSQRVVQDFIQNAGNLRTTIQQLKRDLQFSKILCRFYFGDFEPSVALQKNLVDAQAGVFDDVTVQLIGEEFDNFKQVYEYAANTKSLSVSPVVNVSTDPELLVQVVAYITGANPENTRWKYGKITTHLESYRVISRDLNHTGIKSYVVGCKKRCGITHRNCENLCAPIVLQIAFGFSGSGLDYYHPIVDENGKKFRFPRDGMDKFNVSTYEWEKVQHQNTFRVSRLADFRAIDSANLSQSAINSRTKLRLLLQHLQTI